ncbi:RNA polymerase sigma factor [Lipingzhangella sp. LS1_29]|uniref:RNA polymerase sigma factor n=1 Tax=Lipingzhangella rawalii TaxID=2055835 RepID=A0ABU2H1P4_9ACTN|nr:RNA polymerase sigma factor [Lipingzhangella rawalii]MDS1269208.1 RNA polymerase sigma factor [Lipingzhangella rawalii]
MSRTALATSPSADDSATATLDELLTRGRSQGHLSLAELRAAFGAAGVSPADARSILRELSEAGVQLANGGDTQSVDEDTAEESLEEALAGNSSSQELERVDTEIDGGAATVESTDTAAPEPTEPETAEADLDDQSPAMGDSVHTYLKAIGRRQLLTAAEEVELAKRVEAGLYAEYKLGWIHSSEETTTDAPTEQLSEEQRSELEWIAEDGHRAKAHMLEANLRLVVSVAKKYSDRGMSLLDVVQEGNLGLIRAVEKFDYTKGFKFSTYAMWWIRQAIQRGFADSARTIRLPVHVLELLSKVSRLERDMHQQLGREPTPEELAHELDKTPSQIEELLRITRQPISLDSTIGEDGETRIGDLIEDIDASEASEVVDRQLMADQLRRALDDLEPREATIMSLRFGLMDGRPRTLDEIGKHLGLTRERIRQLEKQSLSKLRHPSRAQQLLDFAS